MSDIELLKNKVRSLQESDNKLPTFSYSKLDLFECCPYKYKLKYIDKNYSQASAIHLDLGTLIHKILEIKGRWLSEGVSVDYNILKDYLYNGVEEQTDKGSEKIKGLSQVKKEWFEDFYTPDNASGLTYEEKIELFMSKVLGEEMEDEEWKVMYNELSFDFVYKYGEHEDGTPKEVKIHGFIDRVDQNKNGDYLVCDYKTSKKIYDPKKMATPMQMSIYSMALFEKFGRIPTAHRYDFVFIDKKQDACTKGYIKRACNKLDKLLNKIDELKQTQEYVPKPCPLCFWCDMSSTNPVADPKTKNLCGYYSLWTPTEKTYSVNTVYENNKPKAATGRKLIF